MEREVNNKIYRIVLWIYEKHIFICNFEIKSNYRNRKYSYRIFNNIQKKYGRDLYLECYPTLFKFYRKLGFIDKEMIDE